MRKKLGCNTYLAVMVAAMLSTILLKYVENLWIK